jgi:hypothetical protein
MSRFPLTRVQTAIATAVVLLVAVVVVVATSGLGPTAVIATPTPGAASTSIPTAGSTQGAASPAATAATSDACVLPAVLPTPEPPDATPVVSTSSAALVFSSYLLQRDANGIVARDQTDEARLLAAPQGGMVLPLAIAPQGDVVAAWWLPEHRGADQQACTSGIYLVPVDGSASVLVASGDWSVDRDNVDGVTWTDPTFEAGAPRSFLLPEASFAADGRFLALHEKDGITIHDRTGAQLGSRTGACPAVNWSATGARFVAGCDEFGSAWLFDATARARQELPIPVPPESKVKSGWEWVGARSIGWLDAERIETVRFYGFPTGCTTLPCELAPPAYAVTTVHAATGAARTVADELTFMADTSRLSPDGSWVYAQTWDEPGWTMELPFGALAQVKRPGSIANGAADGSLLFSTRVLSDDSVRVFSIDPAGATHAVATIAWPAGTTRRYPVIWVGGLSATVPGAGVLGDFATP